MKKTLITLLSLAGVAMAGVEGDWTGTISWAANENPIFTWNESAAMNAPVSVEQLTSSVGYFDPTEKTGYNIPVGTYTPNTNVGEGNPWSLTLTINNTTADTLYISYINLEAFTFSGGALWQQNGRTVTLTLNSKDEVVGTADFTVAGNQGGTSSTLTNVFINTAGANLKLGANESVTLSVTASCAAASATYGTYVGMKGMTVGTSYIPEPATATLSLLALAGLAARRRRK